MEWQVVHQTVVEQDQMIVDRLVVAHFEYAGDDAKIVATGDRRQDAKCQGGGEDQGSRGEPIHGASHCEEFH